SHPFRGIRPPADHGINRPDLHAQQWVQGTGTNRPKTYTHPQREKTLATTPSTPTAPHPTTKTHPNQQNRVTAVHSDRETPGPIPNPEAKPASADDTTQHGWKSRTPPNTH